MCDSYRRCLLFASALLLIAAAPPQQPPSPQQSPAPAAQPVNWRAATREDVIAAYDIFSQHHPGMFDPNNPGFPQKLRRARDEALAFARKADDDDGHMRALELFSAVLADAHARVQAGYNGHGEVLWPGFRTVWRGDSLYVLNNSDGGPPRASVLLGCDGETASNVIRDAVGLEARLAEAGQWWVHAPATFLRGQSRYERLPRRCRFRPPNGEVRTYSLNWRPVSEGMLQSWFGTQRDPIGLTQPRPGIYLIALPTFVPDEKERAQYAQLFRDIDSNIGAMQSARAVVLDLRHNQGGSSSWGDAVADHLWGWAAVNAKLAEYFRKTQIWWLADEANAEHFRNLAAELRVQGRSAVNDGIDMDELATRLEAVRENGGHFFVENYGAMLAPQASNAKARELPPVYVITDGGCVSACLDALDDFTRFPHVKLVGAPTSADSQYIDIRWQALPSGRGGASIPTKIWVGRPRPAGEVYRPDIPVNNLDWTTAIMLDHIERDLAGRPSPTRLSD